MQRLKILVYVDRKSAVSFGSPEYGESDFTLSTEFLERLTPQQKAWVAKNECYRLTVLPPINDHNVLEAIDARIREKDEELAKAATDLRAEQEKLPALMRAQLTADMVNGQEYEVQLPHDVHVSANKICNLMQQLDGKYRNREEVLAQADETAWAQWRTWITVRDERVRLEAEECEARQKAAEKAAEEAKTRHRGEIAALLLKHGRVNERERLDSGCLPIEEVHAFLRELYLVPIQNVNLFTKLAAEDIDADPTGACQEHFAKFESAEVDPTLSAREWTLMQTVCKAHPEAEVSVMRHTAECGHHYCEAEATHRYGLRVRRVVHGEPISIEYAFFGDDVGRPY